jgi:hypothetical protein
MFFFNFSIFAIFKNIDTDDTDGALQFRGAFIVKCNEIDEIEIQTGGISINHHNNRPPLFNQRSYKLIGISKRLPENMNLMAAYPDQLDIWVQDIDRDKDGQVNDDINITVKGMLTYR